MIFEIDKGLNTLVDFDDIKGNMQLGMEKKAEKENVTEKMEKI